MSFFTLLQLNFKEKLLRHRLIFASSANASPTDKKKESISFEPNETVCFLRETFARKKFSATALFIIRTVSPGSKASTIEGVNPGAEILLCVRGETKVKRTLSLLHDLKERSVNLCAISDNVLAAIHTRNEANMSLDFLAERIVEESKIK